MGTRSYIAWAAALAVALGTTHAVFADPKSDAAARSKEAMASYDNMDFEAAKKQLDQALALVKRAKLDKDPVAAKIYVNVGITALAAGDREAAAAAFRSAVQIDAKIQVPAAYRSPAITSLLDQARADAKTAPIAEPGPPGLDCSTVKGLQHTIIDSAKAGSAEPIEALVGADVTPAKVVVMYRTEGATSFVEARLAKQGACKYTGAIPGAAKKGALIHYYVAAYDENNRVIVGKGSSSSPNIMELVGGAPAKSGDGEDPINGRSGGGVSGGVIAGGKPARIYIGVAGGTGLGFVTGTTEANNTVENCCLGTSLVVITPELGYYVTRKLSVGAAARLGLPIGANVAGHATLAPSGLVRVRYALSASGEGIRVMGQLGAGILRNTIKLDNPMSGMDTDIVAQGPLLVGAGVGYMKRLTGSLAFIADLSALGAIAIVDEIGSAPNLNNGLAADLSIGFAFGF